MTDKLDRPEGKVVTRTSPLLLILALAIGFFAGVALSAWKMKAPGYATTAPQGNAKLAQMAQALEQQLAENPNNADLLIRLGNTYFDTDQYAKSIDAYNRALAITPDNANVLTDLGIMYRRNKQPQKAVETFDAAIAVNKEQESAYLNKGIVLFYDLGKRDEAIASWEALREINPLAMAGNQSIDEFIAHFKEGHDKEGNQ
ncbi:tetratricopeptide repeat protein [Desulfoluna butyratoxydans]|uniref:Tpr repeat n=1 Tax=Desulfoluna butyratoxydans TaxID=231438 RepID=A0A4U8YML4_9BACT|nr:tetratricopeptide repeat protein [Desulfoluna butyratoxydans]VFQ44784.1 tpr repeat [Desulfoluna butyratoxydans]